MNQPRRYGQRKKSIRTLRTIDTGIKRIDDGGQAYWPGHLDHLNQPENTGEIDTGIKYIDDGGQAY